MNFNYAVLAQRANASLTPGAANNSEFREIFRERFGPRDVSDEFLAFSGFAYHLLFVYHKAEAIVEERDLVKIVHRFHELSPVSPQIYQQLC